MESKFIVAPHILDNLSNNNLIVSNHHYLNISDGSHATEVFAWSLSGRRLEGIESLLKHL